jgi:hypothetical protein
MLQKVTLPKDAITRLVAVAMALVVAGSVGGAIVVIRALTGGAIAIGGSQLLTVDAEALVGGIVGLLIASLLIAGGTVAAVVAWAAALTNTARLADKTWFLGLLVLGPLSLGWLPLIAYALKGPDSTTSAPAMPAQRPPFSKERP